jgi:hypothetical protein
MEYVTVIRQESVRWGLDKEATLVKVVARVSTRPYDHRAPLRSFTPKAFAAVMNRSQVMLRHGIGTGSRFTPASRFVL